MYTIKEAHEKLNCNRQTINNWIKRLNIDVATIDGMYRLTEEQYNMIADKVNANRTNVYNDGANNTKEDNNSNDYESVIKQYEARIKDLKESHANHVKDLNKQLDKKQETINNLTVSMTMQGLTNKPNTNEDNRSIINSNSGSNSNNVDDTYTYEDAHTRSTDESTNEDVSDTHTDTNSSSDTTQNTDVANSTYDDTTQDDTITNGNSGNVSDQTDKSNDTNIEVSNSTYTDDEGVEREHKIGFFKKLFGRK